LGLAYVAAVIGEKHEVSIIDARGEGWKNVREIDGKYFLGLGYEEIARKVEKLSPDMVGITVPFSIVAQRAFEVADVVKSVNKDIVTILGGPHPSIRPVECVSHPSVDFSVIGEGERTMVELTRVVERGACNELKDVRGIAYKKNGRSMMTSPRNPIQELDSIAFPARHLLPMDAYLEAAREGFAPRARLHNSYPWATMITSRGCPYHCTFCSIHISMGRKFRARSPENVINEIEELVHGFGIRLIDFEDDNLTLDKKRIEHICELIMKRGLDIEWFTPNGVRADTLDENLLRKMQRSGLKQIWVAPESGVQRVVNEVIEKNLNLKKVDDAVILCKKLGIEVGCFFVIGSIGETKADIKATLSYARKLKKLGAHDLSFAIATPYYGTELYEQGRKLGYLRKTLSDEVLSVEEPSIETPEFTAEEIREFHKEGKAIGRALTYASIVRGLRRPKLALNYFLTKIGYKKSWLQK